MLCKIYFLGKLRGNPWGIPFGDLGGDPRGILRGYPPWETQGKTQA